jgi:hypothetical protein
MQNLGILLHARGRRKDRAEAGRSFDRAGRILAKTRRGCAE